MIHYVVIYFYFYFTGLNSGAFMGYLGDIKLMMNHIATIPKDLLSVWPGTDQALYGQLFLSRMLPIELDYSSRLFLSYGISKYSEEIRLYNNITTFDLLHKLDYNNKQHSINYNPKKGKKKYKNMIIFQNSINKVIPSILHFNGDGKHVIKNIINEYNNIWNNINRNKNCSKLYSIIYA